MTEPAAPDVGCRLLCERGGGGGSLSGLVVTRGPLCHFPQCCRVEPAVFDRGPCKGCQKTEWPIFVLTGPLYVTPPKKKGGQECDSEYVLFYWLRDCVICYWFVIPSRFYLLLVCVTTVTGLVSVSSFVFWFLPTSESCGKLLVLWYWSTSALCDKFYGISNSEHFCLAYFKIVWKFIGFVIIWVGFITYKPSLTGLVILSRYCF